MIPIYKTGNTVQNCIFNHQSVKTLHTLQVKRSQLIKIALLVAVLLSLPKTLFIYNMIERGIMDFSAALVADLLLQGVFFFLLSWAILQLCANWAYKYIEHPIVRIIAIVVIGILFLAGTLQLLALVYPSITGQAISMTDKGFIFFKSLIILVVLIFVARILRLQMVQKENLLENEALKQQNLQNELTALKNQIDPHFLFNSLNSLTSLIRDNEEATRFVTKLSFMYRYILQSGDRDLVTVKEELKFLESYIYLIKTRYGDRFSISIAIQDPHLGKYLPPMALQLLVENAVKHNEISGSNPLQVLIHSQEGFIGVENALRPRATLAEGTGNGLSNLNKRYTLLAKQNITVTTVNNIFAVKIPLMDAP